MQLCGNLNIFLALPFYGNGMKTDLTSPVATVESSKFAGILSAALEQHHLLGFEISSVQFSLSVMSNSLQSYGL